jgi:hypothetical protein
MKIDHTGRRLVRPLICALLLAVVGAFAFAAGQNAAEGNPKTDIRKSYALIFGTVWTADDHPAYGVTVNIRRADQKKPKWQLTSDHNGEFAQRVPAGPAD